MTLILNNDDVGKVLTMVDTIAALETAYLQMAAKEAVCRPRIDMILSCRFRGVAALYLRRNWPRGGAPRGAPPPGRSSL